MVIKGQSVAGATRLAVHLQRRDTNERVEVLEMRGVAAEDLEGGLAEMEAVASGTRCQKPFYHASINTRAEERLTDEQRLQAIGRLEAELGLIDQPRVVVLHEKEGREHCHIVWSRIDLDTMKTISDSHNYRKHEIVARELEREFGHERVQGAHIEREGQPRPERTPGHDEMQQASRSGVSPKEAKTLLTDIWQRTDNGQSFRNALEERDWLLAHGDRRDFVAVDPGAGVHSLARRIDGAKARDVREHMADIDMSTLPSVAEAKRLLAERQSLREGKTVSQEWERPQPAQKKEIPDVSPERGRDRFPAASAFAPSENAARDMRDIGRSADQMGQAASKGLFVVLDGVGNTTEKLTDYVADLFGGPAPREHSAAELARDPAARREHYAQQAAERESDEALDRMRLDMEAGKGLSPSDVRALTPAHLMQINAHGDDYLRQVIADHERDQARSSGIERERER